MTDQKNILILYRNSSSIPDQIIQKAIQNTPEGFKTVVCDETKTTSERKAMVHHADYIIAYSVKFDDFDVAKSVKLFQLFSAGFDLLDLQKFKAMNIPVANNGSVNSSTVAEHTILLILSVLKKLPFHHQSLQKGEWLGHRLALKLSEIRGKQIGIIGFGHIGQQVARNLTGFRAKLVYFDPNAAPTETEKSLNVKRMDLKALIASSDIITIHLPLFKDTQGLIGQTEFSSMKETAILINTSRGAIVDEGALIDALNAEGIGGAGLDVFSTEPIEKNNALLRRENVVLTPHIAGTTVDNWERRIEFCFGNILRVSKCEAPLARIDNYDIS